MVGGKLQVQDKDSQFYRCTVVFIVNERILRSGSAADVEVVQRRSS